MSEPVKPTDESAESSLHDIANPDGDTWAFVWTGFDWMTTDRQAAFSPAYLAAMGFRYVCPHEQSADD